MKIKTIMYQGKSYHIAKECLHFIKKQTEIQLYKLYASKAHEVDDKNLISHRAKKERNLQGRVN